MSEEIIINIIKAITLIAITGGLIYTLKLSIPTFIEENKKRNEIENTRNEILKEINKGLKDLNNGK